MTKIFSQQRPLTIEHDRKIFTLVIVNQEVKLSVHLTPIHLNHTVMFWFVGFNFGHVQLLMFVVVVSRSY